MLPLQWPSWRGLINHILASVIFALISENVGSDVIFFVYHLISQVRSRHEYISREGFRPESLQQIFWLGETREIVSIVRRNWKWFIKIFSFNKTFLSFLSPWKSPLQLKLITLNKHWTTTQMLQIYCPTNKLSKHFFKHSWFSQYSIYFTEQKSIFYT